MRFFKAIAAVFGIGYLRKGGGSVAAAAFCLIWFLIPPQTLFVEFLTFILVFALGTWSASKVEASWGLDSYRVVIDEVAGMMIALLSVPKQITYLIFAFVFFRAFDIFKPLGIRKTEQLPSGWGVMADDVLSGIYTLILLRFLIAMKFF